eukprot:TRINITY_DN698_c1_g1_i2.p1 TRINITY_DN698_c1_g1~~TRINITY_DN698_c1_g1_i2.p1  ORF type:complete len:874 (-),score=213.49 TRINITY_DN698_c1_g1_i2:666-3287(-)
MKIQVKLYNAKSLHVYNRVGFTDPWCSISVGNTTSSVTAQKSLFPKIKDINPVWNCVLEFDVEVLDNAILHVQFFDTDDNDKDTKSGDVMIPLSQLSNAECGQELSGWFELQNTMSGEIKLGVTLLEKLPVVQPQLYFQSQTPQQVSLPVYSTQTPPQHAQTPPFNSSIPTQTPPRINQPTQPIQPESVPSIPLVPNFDPVPIVPNNTNSSLSSLFAQFSLLGNDNLNVSSQNQNDTKSKSVNPPQSQSQSQPTPFIPLVPLTVSPVTDIPSNNNNNTQITDAKPYGTIPSAQSNYSSNYKVPENNIPILPNPYTSNYNNNNNNNNNNINNVPIQPKFDIPLTFPHSTPPSSSIVNNNNNHNSNANSTINQQQQQQQQPLMVPLTVQFVQPNQNKEDYQEPKPKPTSQLPPYNPTPISQPHQNIYQPFIPLTPSLPTQEPSPSIPPQNPKISGLPYMQPQVQLHPPLVAVSSPQPQIQSPIQHNIQPHIQPQQPPSIQSPPPPQIVPSPQVIPTPQVVPSPQVVQSPQVPTKPKGLIKFQSSELVREFPNIAKGSFGVVFKGTAKGLPGTVVIKDMEIQHHKSVEDWKKEITVMSQNRSPYVVEVYGYCSHQNILTIVMEYMAAGDLYGILHRKQVPLSLIQRMRMARHCALGLAFLHNNRVIHRDVKSMNILVTEDYSCKLTDFGCAKLISGSRQIYNTVNSGTPLWMAPEVKKGQYSFPADVYSLGLVLYELFENKLPGYDQAKQTVILPQSFQSASVVLPCLNHNPERRPTAQLVVKVLDSMIHNILGHVRELLPESEQEMLRNEAMKQYVEGKDSLELELLQLYRHLLNKPPSEADRLISRAVDLNGVEKPNNNNNVPQQQQQAPMMMG